MVIAIYPMLSNKTNLNADSNYIFIKNVITGILKKRPNWYFLYLFPNNSEWSYRPDGFLDNPQIIRIPMYMPTAKKHMVSHFDARFFQDYLVRHYAYDTFLNNTVEITNQILTMQQTYTRDGMFKTINQHHYVVHSDLPYVSTELGDKGIILSQLSGTLLADMNIFNSKNCKRMIDENYEKFWGKVPDYKYHIIPFGFDFDYYDQNAQPKTEEISFVWNHRFQNYKNWRDTFEVYDVMWKKGYKFKVYITSISAKVNEVLKLPYVVNAPNLYSHPEYCKYISKAWINMTNSQHETFCISAVESMLYKQCLVAPRAATFPELTPNGYSYLFDTKKEQLTMVEYLLTHPEEITKQGELCNRFVRETFTEDVFVDNWIAAIEEGNKATLGVMLKGLKKKDQLKEYLSTLDGKVPTTLMHMRLRQWIGQQQAFTNVRLKRLLNHFGFEDYFEHGAQYYRRVTTS